MVIDQFDEMLEQSRKYPLVFAVSVHPFIIGQPFRLRAFRDALRHIVCHRDRLWITTPGEIALLQELAKRHDPRIGVAHGSRGRAGDVSIGDLQKRVADRRFWKVT
jgi:hypothetical protein